MLHWNVHINKHWNVHKIQCKELWFIIFVSVFVKQMKGRRTKSSKEKNASSPLPQEFIYISFGFNVVQPPSELKNHQFDFMTQLLVDCKLLQSRDFLQMLQRGGDSHTLTHRDTQRKELCSQTQSGLSYLGRRRHESLQFSSRHCGTLWKSFLLLSNLMMKELCVQQICGERAAEKEISHFLKTQNLRKFSCWDASKETWSSLQKFWFSSICGCTFRLLVYSWKSNPFRTMIEQSNNIL